MKQKHLINKGIAKPPVIMQLEALECGAACLAMILAYFNKWIPLEQVRFDCGVSRDGSNAKNILLAARNYGLSANGYKIDLEELKKEGEFPCIIHWNFNHFVVLNGFRGNYAYINDPATGQRKVPLEEFDNSFTGIVLLMEPGEGFIVSGKKRSTFDYIKSRLSLAKTAMLFVTLTSIIATLLGVISPTFSRIFYDRLLTGQNPEWLGYFTFAFIIFIILQLIITWINSIYTYKIDGKIASIGSCSFMWKILRLPMNFFSQRMTGDILSRENSNASIAKALTQTIIPLFFNGVMAVIYFVIMVRYNYILTIISLSSIIVEAIVGRIISYKRKTLTFTNLRDSSKLASLTTSGIEMIETIKSSGSENGFFEKWSGYQASAHNAKIKSDDMNYTIGLIPQFVSTLSSLTILGIGLYLTYKGQFTLGMITAFNGFLVSFSSPISSFIQADATIQNLKIEAERVDDVMNYPLDPLFNNHVKQKEEKYTKLTGNIEIKNISFGYSRLEEPLIKDFSLSLNKGKSVAFVGSSGCGKSTLSKLITGMQLPWSGEILYDGKRIDEIDRSVFTGSLACVDQDIILFEDTINNNIKMWDESIENFEAILAARDAQIHEDIMLREGGYDFKLNEGGKNFSGGQRQRLEIARALASDPTIIILDEATSALDAKTEFEVVKSIKDRGIACIVIAHRLSTIRDCDEIVVLDHGKVVERGKHEELIKLNGFYTSLVTND